MLAKVRDRFRYGYSLSKNFVKPSKVCASEEIAVPTVANAAWMTPKIVLKIAWKTAKIEPSAAVIVWKMPATRLPRESTREGMIAMYCDTVSCVLTQIQRGQTNDF